MNNITAKQIAEEHIRGFLKFIVKDNLYVETDGTIWKDAFAGGRDVTENRAQEYLSRFDEGQGEVKEHCPFCDKDTVVQIKNYAGEVVEYRCKSCNNTYTISPAPSQAEPVEGKGEDGWISVEKELPEECVKVICKRKRHGHKGDIVFGYYENENGKDVWYDEYEHDIHQDANNNYVTHWMPISVLDNISTISCLTTSLKEAEKKIARMEMVKGADDLEIRQLKSSLDWRVKDHERLAQLCTSLQSQIEKNKNQ